MKHNMCVLSKCAFRSHRHLTFIKKQLFHLNIWNCYFTKTTKCYVLLAYVLRLQKPFVLSILSQTFVNLTTVENVFIYHLFLLF